MKQVLERAKSVLMSPKEALLAVKTEVLEVTDFMKQYIAVLAAIPPLAYFIGMLGHFPFFRSLFFVVLLYVASLVAVFVFAKIIDALARTFNSVQSTSNAFKLSAYSFTPVFVAGVFNINPTLSILTIIGTVYAVYILYLGLPVLMETPSEKVLAYTVVTLLVAAVVWIILGLIIGAIVWGGGFGLPH